MAITNHNCTIIDLSKPKQFAKEHNLTIVNVKADNNIILYEMKYLKPRELK